MSLRVIGVAITVMLLAVAVCPEAVCGQDAVQSRPRILFYGLWDRAFQQMASASEETGIPVQMRGITHHDKPSEITESIQEVDFEKFDLVYVLQIDQMQAHLLVEPLKQAKQNRTSLRIVRLDRRGSQQELIDEGILEVDPKVRAYWRGFGKENLKRLLVYSQVEYLGGAGEVQEPVPAATSGLYHPDAEKLFGDWPEYMAWYSKQPEYRDETPLVAVFVQQDYIIYGNSRVYDALTHALERRGNRVAMMFGTRDSLQIMLRACKPDLLMLQHHSGPEDAPGPDQLPFLEQLDVPYIYSAGMMSGITVDEWKDDIRGLKMAGYGQLTRHELYGIIEPHLIGAGSSSAYGFAMDEPIAERVDSIADRVNGWLRLRTTPASEKRVAIIYFHKYLGKADIGRPAPEMSRYLDPHASLLVLLKAMSAAGYDVGSLPASPEELLSIMKRGGRNIPSWAPGEMASLLAEGNPVLLPEEQYRKWYSEKLSPQARASVEESHGLLPGKFMVTEKDGKKFIVLPAIRFGNVLIAPQPDRGSLQDRDLVHSRIVPPPHNYLAFYWWLEEEYGADAMVHFGTHGSDFYLPGKEIFLSGDCFPDIIVGSMPNFYVWTIQNIGEAVIAKRRSYSVIVDHGVPPILAISRDAEALDLLELIDRYGVTTAPPVKQSIAAELTTRVKNSPLLDELNLYVEDDHILVDQQINRLANHLQHMSDQSVVHGMHILGVLPGPQKALPFVEHIVARNTDLVEKLQAAGVTGDPDEQANLLFEELLIKSSTPKDAASRIGLPVDQLSGVLAPEIELARTVWDGLGQTGDEITNLLAGLEGRYVPPGPGGDPILRPDVLPTGRNMYGCSPREIPTRQAWALAKSMTDEFLAKFHEESGRYPEKLAFSMTGMETFRNMGVMEAQIMYLLGVQPEWSPGRQVSGLKVIPRKELGRPRVDVVMSVNGIYLKDFAPCVRILDEAVRLAAACDEDDNVVRANTDRVEGELKQMGVNPDRARELAQARAIGSEAGGGGARLVWFLPRSGTWQERSEIVELWRTMRTHVYTGDIWGEQLPELHDKVYAGTEGVITNWSDNLLGPLTNHHYPEETGGLAISVQWITGKAPPVSVFDLRQRSRGTAISLEEVLSLELRSAAFNKDWIEGQMAHNYIGATQFMQIVDNTFQWEAVREGAVWPGAWDKSVDVYVRDSFKLDLRSWFEEHNPFAFQELTATLLEASRKGYWSASPETLREIAVAHADSVARFGHGAGPYAGGNQRMREYLLTALDQPGDELLRKTFLQKIAEAEEPKLANVPEDSQESPESEPVEKNLVTGNRMEQVTEQKEPQPTNDVSSRQWTVYLCVVIAVLALVLIGYRLRVGSPTSR